MVIFGGNVCFAETDATARRMGKGYLQTMQTWTQQLTAGRSATGTTNGLLRLEGLTLIPDSGLLAGALLRLTSP